jgi:hypothetical protein
MRLCTRYRSMTVNGKKPTVVVCPSYLIVHWI